MTTYYVHVRKTSNSLSIVALTVTPCIPFHHGALARVSLLLLTSVIVPEPRHLCTYRILVGRPIE